MQQVGPDGVGAGKRLDGVTGFDWYRDHRRGLITRRHGTESELLAIDLGSALSFVTQTTLSMDDTAQIVRALQAKFPHITGPTAEDICYATQNRQNAVKQLAKDCEVILVLGAPNSSNSNRLVEVAQVAGCRSYLLETAADLQDSWVSGATAVGVTAGASAPEVLVQELLDALQTRGATDVETLRLTEERVQFSLPKELSQS